MFMNWVLLTKEPLDVLEKFCSIACTKFSFQISKILPSAKSCSCCVGLCLYNCDYHLPGVKGDYARAKVWDAV